MKRDQVGLVFGALLILLGGLLLLETFGLIHVVGRLIWSLVLMAIGVPFLLVYLANRNQWWALIPGCIMAGVGVGVLVGGELAGIIITGSVSLPFWLIYLSDRENWWALIPGWVMACVSTIVLLAWIGLDWFIAPFVMFAIAAPFLLVYLQNREQWWALIPGGIMAGVGFLILLGELMNTGVAFGAILIVGGLLLVYRALRTGRAGGGTTPPQPAQRFEVSEEPDPAAQPDQPR